MSAVVVVGGGVGGLAAAHFLRATKSVGRIVVVERRSTLQRPVDRGLGLWPAALHCLDQLDVPALRQLLQESTRIPPAAYRNTDGKWLSSASDTPSNAQLVTSVPQNALLKALGDFEADRETEVRLDVDLSEVLQEIRPELVVHATGLPLPETSPRFHCISGMLRGAEVPLAWSAESEGTPRPFETLGPDGLRLACVPVQSGLFWFATVPLSHSSGSESKQPFSDDEWLAMLQQSFRWHSPVPEVLQAAVDSASPLLIEPMGSASDYDSFAGTAFRVPLRGDPVDREGFADARVQCELTRDCAIASQFDLGGARYSVVGVGDLVHPMGHNLAQGAALAIEDGYALAHAVKTVGTSPDLLQAQIRSDRQHQRRVRQCGLATRFTEVIAASPSWLQNMIGLVPQPVNGWVFDAALRFSFGQSINGK